MENLVNIIAEASVSEEAANQAVLRILEALKPDSGIAGLMGSFDELRDILMSDNWGIEQMLQARALLYKINASAAYAMEHALTSEQMGNQLESLKLKVQAATGELVTNVFISRSEQQITEIPGYFCTLNVSVQRTHRKRIFMVHFSDTADDIFSEAIVSLMVKMITVTYPMDDEEDNSKQPEERV